MAAQTDAVSEDIRKTIRGRLVAEGLRPTDARMAVIDTLRAAAGPVSVAQLHEATDVPLSSVYRTVAMLTEAAVVRSPHGSDGEATFELAEEFVGHHHHMRCLVCGSVEDVHLAPAEERQLEGIGRSVADRIELDITGHTYEMEGMCKRCRP